MTLVTGLSLIATPQAFALSKHTFSTVITGSGSNALSAPVDVAVDQSTGDVYVADPGRHRIEKFGPSGEFILTFGSGVDGTTGGDVCTAESGDECQAGASGTEAGAFIDPDYLAVDNTGVPGQQGDVYVGDSVPGATNVQKYNPRGEIIPSWADGGRLDGTPSQAFAGLYERGVTGLAVDPSGKLFVYAEETLFEFGANGSPNAAFQPSGTHLLTDLSSSLAVDGADNLYYPDVLSSAVFKLTPQGDFLGEVLGGGGTEIGRISIDSGTRELYLTRPSGKVEHFPASCDLPADPCSPAETFGAGKLSNPGGVAIDESTDTVYVADTNHKRVAVFTAQPYLPKASSSAAADTSSSESLSGVADPAGAGEISSCSFEYTPSSAFDAVQTVTVSGATGGTFTLSITSGGQTTGIPYNATAQEVQAILATRTGAGNVGVTGPAGGPYRVEFEGAFAERHFAPMFGDETRLTPNGATVTVQTVNPGGEGWPAGTSVSCEPPAPIIGSAPQQVTAEATGLESGTGYHYRLGLGNAAGANAGYEQAFTTLPAPPTVEGESVSEVHADTAAFHVRINPGGGESSYQTSYRVEYVTQGQFEKSEAEGEDGFSAATLGPILIAGSAKSSQGLTASLSGLPSGTIFHYRILATNECKVGIPCATTGASRTFATLPFLREPNEPCGNAHVRQQTGSAALLDCRAYELASAPDTAGYDVESNLVPGQMPFGASGETEGRVLYGVHDGGIPGTGEPTNRGVDPYVAVRGANGWTTKYVGIPADGTSAEGPFGSPLLEGDSELDTFAFGGAGLCAPCFGDHTTGIPITHLGSEELIQGMSQTEGPDPNAKPDGFIAKHLSANGEHLVFGSTSRFAPGGNDGTGDVSIYDRNLTTRETSVVSNAPSAANGPVPLPCLQGAGKCDSAEGDANGISELGISSNGSRILLGQKVSTDALGNVYWHLYMDVDDAVSSIDLTPGVLAEPAEVPAFSEGVLFDGMSADGSKVFFTTADRMLPTEDTDSSPDLYEAEVSGNGVASLHLISIGAEGPSNSDACMPGANSNGPHWNVVGGAANCGVVAVGGGGGVASSSGKIYFLSPEKLTSPCACAEPLLHEPVQGQPNLYVATPGSAPVFVSTLELENPLVLDAVAEGGTRHTADFQTTPAGVYAAFSSALALSGQEEETAGNPEIYRYDAAAKALDCASCTPTGEPSSSAASLAENGLSLTDDGRVFFTTPGRLAAADTDGVDDVYEWEPLGTGNCRESSASFSPRSRDCLALISTGTSAVASGLLGVSANGADAFFFTRDSLVAQDKNGPTVKIYDARENGGFPFVPLSAECRASDECHGPASVAPPPMLVGSETGTPDNYEKEKRKRCRRGLLLKHGHCVRRLHRKHHKGGRK
ncbi:MAG: NHL repeat-containing protein [Solirubrobacterales bacterium]